MLVMVMVLVMVMAMVLVMLMVMVMIAAALMLGRRNRSTHRYCAPGLDHTILRRRYQPAVRCSRRIGRTVPRKFTACTAAGHRPSS